MLISTRTYALNWLTNHVGGGQHMYTSAWQAQYVSCGQYDPRERDCRSTARMISFRTSSSSSSSILAIVCSICISSPHINNHCDLKHTHTHIQTIRQGVVHMSTAIEMHGLLVRLSGMARPFRRCSNTVAPKASTSTCSPMHQKSAHTQMQLAFDKLISDRLEGA
jgi:hypothetical protein